MSARPNLRAVPSGELPDDAPSYSDLIHATRDLEDKNAGLLKTVEKQAREMGALERKLKAEDDPATHPKRAEIKSLVAHWKKVTGHEKARDAKDRFDLVKARLKDGYTVEEIELALDGLGAFPFVVNAQRRAAGKPSQRFDQMKHALSGGETLERFANLGAVARREAA